MTQKPDNPPAYVRVVVTSVNSNPATVSAQYLDDLPQDKSLLRRLLQYILKARESRHDD